jgi:hypothetical protein
MAGVVHVQVERRQALEVLQLHLRGRVGPVVLWLPLAPPAVWLLTLVRTSLRRSSPTRLPPPPPFGKRSDSGAATLRRKRTCESQLPWPSSAEKEGSDTAPVTTVRPDPIEPGGDACTTPTLCWSRKVALEAGFRIAGSSGSAWIVKGRNRSFYFWATRSANDLRAEGYRVVRRLAGVEILTDGVRLVWRLRRATIWIEAGPTEDSIAPKPGELAELIAASRTLASG